MEDIGFMPSLWIHAFCETSKALSSTLSDVGDVCNSCYWAQTFDKIKRALTSIAVMCFLQNILLITSVFKFFEDCLSLFYKLLRSLVGTDISENLMI